MKHKSFEQSDCPIARSLELVGEWWSILILREAFYGATKFDDFQQGVDGIAPNTLTRRLKELVEAGLFERKLYNERPERFEYVLTPRGRDFYPVMWALMQWGNKHCAPEGDLVQLRNVKTGKKAVPHFVDRTTGEEMRLKDYTTAPGPGASEAVRKRYAASN
jgi:DNA-binding HxlR family transcriptional regulator